MEEITRKEIKSLNISLELITFLINVPIGGAFISLWLNAQGERFIHLLTGIGIASITAIIYSTSLRSYLLSNLILQDLSNKNENELILYKSKLFNAPILSGLVVVQSQWIIGALITMIYFCSRYGFTFHNTFVFLLLLIYLSPLNFFTHAATTDIFLGKILLQPDIARIRLSKEILIKSSGGFNIFVRILAAIGSSIFFVLAIFATIYIKGIIQENSNPYNDYYLLFILAQAFVVIFNSSRIVANTIRKNIVNLETNISELAKGNLRHNISITDTEEISQATIELNLFREKILDVLTGIQDTSVKLNHISQNLQLNAREVSKEAQSQAAFSEEISASFEEFSASISQSEQVVAEQVKSVESSVQSLTQLENEIQTTLEYSNESNKLSILTKTYSNEGKNLGKISQNAMEIIKNESKDIEEYTKIIADISERVGLLSLNASIEAARAGNEGRGFAVVANEISKLGENTNENSSLIQKKVISLSKKVNDGFDKNENLLKNFSSILDASEQTDVTINKMISSMKKQIELEEKVMLQLNELKSKSNSIDNYSKEQRSTLNAFNSGVDTLRHGSQNLAISAESLNEISNELSIDAKLLVDRISFFKIK